MTMIKNLRIPETQNGEVEVPPAFTPSPSWICFERGYAAILLLTKNRYPPKQTWGFLCQKKSDSHLPQWLAQKGSELIKHEHACVWPGGPSASVFNQLKLELLS